MKLTKKILTGCTVSLILVAASATAFASPSYKTPAEVVAGITGRPVESVIEEKKEQNKSYGTIASEAGKLDEFLSVIIPSDGNEVLPWETKTAH